MVYGTDVYTSDSNLATAAVHAGRLAPGQTGEVRVRIVPVLPSYQGSTRNGVTTKAWANSWTGAYRIEHSWEPGKVSEAEPEKASEADKVSDPLTPIGISSLRKSSG